MKFILLPASAVLCGLFLTVTPASAQIGTVWQKRNAPNITWSSVASSAAGTKIIAVASVGLVHISTNAGDTWTPTTVSVTVPQGRTVACSANGQVIAIAPFGNLRISTDGGATWNNRASQNWSGIACSTNGTKMVALVTGGQIYTSTDTGTNWTARDSARPWADVASSADGTKLVAVAGGTFGTDRIYTSVDSGTNWTARATTQYWTGVASSADGTKLLAVNAFDSNYPTQGRAYFSSDSGTNWNPIALPLNWISAACSADGNRLAMVSQTFAFPDAAGMIFATTDAGNLQASYAPDHEWEMITSSADGKKLVAIAGNEIYTYAVPSTNAPALNIATTGGSASLSWPWPSEGFVLQQNSNIATTNWVNVSNPPAVVNQVIVTQTNANNFYRLIKP
jgi:hypothetical protein